MNLIDFIPIGKENKKTRQELMNSVKITDIRAFRQEIVKLRKKYTIIEDNGYYLPRTKEEYLEFIQKQNQRLCDTAKTIDLAYKEMEELNYE